MLSSVKRETKLNEKRQKTKQTQAQVLGRDIHLKLNNETYDDSKYCIETSEEHLSYCPLVH